MKFLFAIVASLALSTASISVYAKTFLWQVKSESTVVYLYGSIHLATKSMYPLNPEVEKAFKSTDKLVVEVNQALSDKAKVDKILKTKAIYSGDETLEDHLDSQTKSMLKAYLKQHKIPYISIAKMHPTMAAISITIMRMMQLGFSPELGIDMHFINQAREQGKPILQLESEEQQLNLLLGFPDENLFLRYSLASLSTMEEDITALVSAWKTGNVDKMHEFLLQEPLHEHPMFDSLFKKLFTERNSNMTKKIKQYLATSHSYFVVVGAGHLVGEDGLVSLLEKAGYDVKQL